MSDKKNKEIIQDKLNEVTENLKHQDFLNTYILETLDSFAYRYFQTPQKAQMLTSNTMIVNATEIGIKEALKLKNSELRAGIGEMAKKVTKADELTIQRELRVAIVEKDPRHKGVCNISARISFGHPKHDFSPGTYVEKLSVLNFEDDLHFRNTLAKHLEEVCELF